ncbi:Subtilisin-like protease SBT4.3 [Zea mays]|uniref:Subtilisin-like protease SBT4.3 n=1 Tax=Zea mays TaxID=4577 RepID=A0A3L6E4V6_MAIZE|nr:Subtilisin-like protease SBT4.3 [Zea mays]
MPRLLLLLLLLTAIASETFGDGDQVYIVYLGHLPSSADASEHTEGFSAVELAHHDLLDQVLDGGSSASDRILRSYKRSLNGFAAKLSKEEAHKLSVFPSRTLDLLTTRSWDFLGFPQTPIQELPLEGDVIVGMLDTGVWPDSPSFSDEGFGPPPSSKIIGARAYNGGSSSSGQSPLDDDGHGSHTASTAAGRAVGNVSMYGLAGGTARGGVPGARLAIYKVCCGEADILAGFDDAIADGVDVISISIGSPFPFDYFGDVIAIGSFHAMRRGVVTSAAAGNSGLDLGNVCNVAPWMLSVAASSIDRRFVDRIVLGNGKTIVGASINTFPTLSNATLAFPVNGSCDPENLAGGSYKGKIVLCQNAAANDGSGPLLAGAAGVVIVSRIPDVAFALPLPGLTVSQDQFDQTMAYVNSTSHPVGTIDRTETTVDPHSTSSGSRLLLFSRPQPDHPSSLEGIPNDTRKVQYNIISGTSMACPHASGAAAALKYGAGQLNLVSAHDPGLVYDASESDYVAMLCAQGYNATQLALVTGSNATAACSNSSTPGSPGNLNYPTMAVPVEPGKNFTAVFPRTVTNVGAATAVYDVRVGVPAEAASVVSVQVSPARLVFSEQNQKVSFTVTVSGAALQEGTVYSFTVVWYNDEHTE